MGTALCVTIAWVLLACAIVTIASWLRGRRDTERWGHYREDWVISKRDRR